MNAPVKLTAFAVTLTVLFGGGALAGGAVGPERAPRSEAHDADAAGRGDRARGAGAEHTSEATGADGGSESAAGHGAARAARPVRGLAVAENGLRLVLADSELRRGRTETARFRIVGEQGRTVRDFDVEHTKRMHLIVVRRDLTGFQHLHPRMRADGTWSLPLRLQEAGSYRVFADFSHQDRAATLASDLRVDGSAALEPLPSARPTAASDGGYQVQLDAGEPGAGQEADLRFTITKDGRRVQTEPYLGAGGHLVALREGDLAFLHVHPTEGAHGGAKAADDDAVGFMSTFPTTGTYRLFLQFKHEGRVQTAAFTTEVK